LDVRIVYAPPESIGSYGGDIDNWMWPRHTCDFTFLRAYVSKDNVGVPYSKDNVPYRPKSVFKVSLDGLKEGDLTFIMGYPGRTFLNYTVSEYRASIGDMKEDIDFAQKAIDFFGRAWKNNRALQIKYASRVRSLNNGLKNRTGKLEGLGKGDVENKKKAGEQSFTQWVNGKPGRKKAYSGILEKIAAFMTDNESFYKKERRLSRLVS
ncbi:MAG: S46 family peptidase, partial [bacterium]|nr:S46 family peptidase [bacterium]